MEGGDVQNRDQRPGAPGFLRIGNTFRFTSRQEGSISVAKRGSQRPYRWGAEQTES
jgi:hypothetical protein